MHAESMDETESGKSCSFRCANILSLNERIDFVCTSGCLLFLVVVSSRIWHRARLLSLEIYNRLCVKSSRKSSGCPFQYVLSSKDKTDQNAESSFVHIYWIYDITPD